MIPLKITIKSCKLNKKLRDSFIIVSYSEENKEGNASNSHGPFRTEIVHDTKSPVFSNNTWLFNIPANKESFLNLTVNKMAKQKVEPFGVASLPFEEIVPLLKDGDVVSVNLMLTKRDSDNKQGEISIDIVLENTAEVISPKCFLFPVRVVIHAAVNLPWLGEKLPSPFAIAKPVSEHRVKMKARETTPIMKNSLNGIWRTRFSIDMRIPLSRTDEKPNKNKEGLFFSLVDANSRKYISKFALPASCFETGEQYNVGVILDDSYGSYLLTTIDCSLQDQNLSHLHTNGQTASVSLSLESIEIQTKETNKITLCKNESVFLLASAYFTSDLASGLETIPSKFPFSTVYIDSNDKPKFSPSRARVSRVSEPSQSLGNIVWKNENIVFEVNHDELRSPNCGIIIDFFRCHFLHSSSEHTGTKRTFLLGRTSFKLPMNEIRNVCVNSAIVLNFDENDDSFLPDYVTLSKFNAIAHLRLSICDYSQPKRNDERFDLSVTNSLSTNFYDENLLTSPTSHSCVSPGISSNESKVSKRNANALSSSPLPNTEKRSGKMSPLIVLPFPQFSASYIDFPNEVGEINTTSSPPSFDGNQTNANPNPNNNSITILRTSETKTVKMSDQLNASLRHSRTRAFTTSGSNVLSGTQCNVVYSFNKADSVNENPSIFYVPPIVQKNGVKEDFQKNDLHSIIESVTKYIRSTEEEEAIQYVESLLVNLNYYRAQSISTEKRMTEKRAKQSLSTSPSPSSSPSFVHYNETYSFENSTLSPSSGLLISQVKEHRSSFLKPRASSGRIRRSPSSCHVLNTNEQACLDSSASDQNNKKPTNNTANNPGTNAGTNAGTNPNVGNQNAVHSHMQSTQTTQPKTGLNIKGLVEREREIERKRHGIESKNTTHHL